MARRPSAFIQSSGRRVGLSPFSRCVAGGPCELLCCGDSLWGATCGAMRGAMRGVTCVDVHVRTPIYSVFRPRKIFNGGGWSTGVHVHCFVLLTNFLLFVLLRDLHECRHGMWDINELLS